MASDVGLDAPAFTSRICPSTNPRADAPAGGGRDSAATRGARARITSRRSRRHPPRPPRSRAPADEPGRGSASPFPVRGCYRTTRPERRHAPLRARDPPERDGAPRDESRPVPLALGCGPAPPCLIPSCPRDRREEPMDLTGRVALVAGATRGAGRGIATELGAAGATVYVTGRSTRAARSEYDRPETIEETAELVDGRGRACHRRRRRPPRRAGGRGARRADQGGGGPARRPRQRRLGRRAALRVGQAGLGARPRQRPPPPPARHRHPPDHRPPRPAADARTPGRPPRRDDRRHRRLQRRPLPDQPVLRPRQGGGEPHGLGARQGPRARAARPRSRSPPAGSAPR